MSQAIAPQTQAFVRIGDGAGTVFQVAVPPTLLGYSTFVLLQDERWFEHEISLLRHVLQPGDHFVDIGANIGVYAHQAAALVGEAGRVVAFEPAPETAAFLRAPPRGAAAVTVEVVEAAVADSAGTVTFMLAPQSEFNSLAAAGEAPAGARPVEVRQVVLDAEVAARGLAPAMVKIDAEGAELAVLNGGTQTWAVHRPIIMMELWHAAVLNEAAWHRLIALDYQLYRWLPALQVLAPSARPGDLNTIAVPPERVADLAARGLLVTPAALDAARGESPPTVALDGLLARPEAQLLRDAPPIDPRVRRALGHVAAYGDVSLSPARRLAAWEAAFSILAVLPDEPDVDPAVLLLAARVAADGRNALHANQLASRLLALVASPGTLRVGHGFLPAAPRLAEGIAQRSHEETAYVSLAELLIWINGFSPMLKPQLSREVLRPVLDRPGTPAYMRRAGILLSALLAERANLVGPQPLLAVGSLNPAFWVEGMAGLARPH